MFFQFNFFLAKNAFFPYNKLTNWRKNMTFPHYVKEGRVLRRTHLKDKIRYLILVWTKQIKEIK